MKNLKKQFDSLLADYLHKRPSFKKKISKYRKAKAQRVQDVLNKLDTLSSQIQDDIEVSKDKESLKALDNKIKLFKKEYDGLCELVASSWFLYGKALFIAIVVVVVIRTFIFGLYRVSSGSGEVNLLVGDRIVTNKLSYTLNRKPNRGDLVTFKDPAFNFKSTSGLQAFWQNHVGLSIPLLGLRKGPDTLVKRVVAVPGDTIEGRIEGGRTAIYLNGKRLYEPYVNPYPLIALEKETGFIPFNRFFFIKMPDFLKKKSKIVHYSYDPEVDFSDQPFYEMYSDEVVLKPRMLIPWFKMSGMPTKDKEGKIVDQFGPYLVPENKYWVMGDSRRNSVDSRIWGFLNEELILGKSNLILYSIDSQESLWLFDLIKRPLKFWKKNIRWERLFKKLKHESGLIA